MHEITCRKSVKKVWYHAKKKTIKYQERDEAKRAEFIKAIYAVPKDRIVYVDETGIDSYLYRPYARSMKGQRVFGKISGRKYKRTSIVAGQSKNGIVAPLQYSGTMDSTLFLFWFTNILLPCLAPGNIIVMDNARFHSKRLLLPVAIAARCDILFLPPYSPDLNKIEHFWAWLKNKLRKILPLHVSLDDAITACFNGE